MAYYLTLLVPKSNPPLFSESVAWCFENVDASWTTWHATFLGVRVINFRFDREEDAVLFKLTFSEYISNE